VTDCLDEKQITMISNREADRSEPAFPANVVFLFPGQGSQEVGMGQDLFKGDAGFRRLVSLASDVTHEDLEKLCLRGPERKLRKAQFLQPLLAAVSLGYLRHVREAGIAPRVVLGHSLGEITSLAASGVIRDDDAVAIAAKRGELMDEAASKCNGTMMAVLFMALDKVNELLAETNAFFHASSGAPSGAPDRIVLANDNAPNQIVISGDTAALDEFSRRVAGQGLGKCKSILVSGPWHSPFMASAHDLFRAWVAAIRFSPPSTSLVLNGTARSESDPEVIRRLVTDQLVRPVQWRRSMDAVRDLRPDAILEIGPGRILSGLVRVNGFPKKTVVYNINNMAGLHRAVQELPKAAYMAGGGK
jgi:[acyl-carrier-protein] S-malonyltransferase